MLIVSYGQYPNGQNYGTFFIDDDEIGRATYHDNGWIPVGGRKVLPSDMAMAKYLLNRTLKRLKNETDKARKLLDRIASQGDAK